MRASHLTASRPSDFEDPRDRRLYRVLEMLPGLLAWGTIIFGVVLSRFAPAVASLFIICFVLSWFLRSVYMSLHLKWTYARMKEHEEEDWLSRLNSLSSFSVPADSWRDVYHLVVFPVYKESVEILRGSLRAIEASDYPNDRIIVALSFEEREGEAAKEKERAIREEFSSSFFRLITTFHPDGIPGELAGKGANETWGTKRVKEEVIDPLGIPCERVILSSLDADTAVFPKYFSCLSYHYLTAENPLRTSFQPVPLYNNNIWDAPALSRIFSFSSTFWQMMNQSRPEKLITFSSSAMSLATMVEVGYKQVNVVSEDSRIFWQAFLFYDGDYRVEPLHYPVSMDSNVAPSFWQTMANLYRQKRRYAYGAENTPYFLFGFLKNKKIPLRRKLSLGFEMLEGGWSWATAPILIYVLGWLPLLLGGDAFTQTLLSYSLPRLTSRVLTVSMIGLVGSAYVSILTLPPRPPSYGRYKALLIALQWFMVPFTMIFISAVPALEAQTRLLLGKRMGFWTTPKHRPLEAEGAGV